MDDNDKKDDFKQERKFGLGSKMPIDNAFNEPVEMNFVGYGDHATFLHIQDTFSGIPGRNFFGYREKGRTNGRNGKRKCGFRMGSFFRGRQK